MDDPAGVGVVDGPGEQLDQPGRVPGRPRDALEVLGQAPAVHELHPEGPHLPPQEEPGPGEKRSAAEDEIKEVEQPPKRRRTRRLEVPEQMTQQISDISIARDIQSTPQFPEIIVIAIHIKAWLIP